MSATHPRLAQLGPGLEAYGLEALSLEALTQGTFCEAYKVKTRTGTFAARLRALEAQPEEVAFARKWAQTVAAEVPVPVPLAPIGGEVPLCEDRCLDIAPYVASNKAAEPGPNAWTTVGAWLGRMHRLGQGLADAAPTALDYGNHPHEALFGRYLEQARVGCRGKDELALMRRADAAAERVRQAVLPLLPALPVGVVHGDYHFWNILYKDGAPVAVIDLDFLQRGVLAHDLAYASHWLAAWGRRGGAWRDIRARYLGAYEEGRQQSLSPAERASLPWLHAYSSIFFFVSKARLSWRRVARDTHDLSDAEGILKSL